jgi:RHS repeat-associated protein
VTTLYLQLSGDEKMPFCFTGKEKDDETGFTNFGARLLDPKTSRWLSVDPAMGEYIPQAPVNDEARKHNQNLPGMGGIFNVVNANPYHYAGNNPIKYTDPDGKWLGLKKAAEDFNTKMKNVPRVGRTAIMSFVDYLRQLTVTDRGNARKTIQQEATRVAGDNFKMNLKTEIDSYTQSEITRYEAFAEIRGGDALTFGVANRILDTAKSTYERAESYARSTGKSVAQAKRYAENEANKIIDDFISNHNPNYVPPEPINEEL